MLSKNMPLDHSSSDGSCDLDFSHRTVCSDGDGASSNVLILNKKTSESSDNQMHASKSPTRPKSGSSFSIKYLLGLDKTSSSTSLGYVGDSAKRNNESPTETPGNSA